MSLNSQDLNNRSSRQSRWIKCISTKGNIRGVAIEATELVQGMIDRHQLTGFGAKALGEATIAALTIASYCKGSERVNINIQGTGPISQALVDAHPDGTVRGYTVVRESGGVVPPNYGPWGDGFLSVLRTKEENEQPFIGTVPLLTGHLAKDMTFYWMQSEQVPSAVGLAVKLDADGKRVLVAGGFLVQAMPGADDSELKAIELHINEIQSLAENLDHNSDPVALLSQIFQDTAFMLVEEKPLQFRCNCSWERVNRALVLVGPQELQSMLTEDGAAVIRCDFCTTEYRVEKDALQKLIDSTQGPRN